MKFMALVKNELIKLFSHKSTIVIISIILAITVLWSVIDVSDFERLASGSINDDLPITYCNVDSAKSEYEENKLRAEKAGVVRGDWRADYYVMIQEYTDQYYTYMEWIDELTDNRDYYDYAAENVYDDIKMYQESADGLRKAINEYWSIIEKNDYASLLKAKETAAEEKFKAFSEWKSKFRAILIGQNASEEELEAFDLYVKYAESLSGYIKEAYETGIEKNIDGSPAVNNEVGALETALASLPASTGTMGEINDKVSIEEMLERYKRLGVDLDYETYTEYLENARDQLSKPIEQAAIVAYAFENGVTEMTSADSTRNEYRGILTFSLFEFVALFGIFIAGNIVSSEYSRKTINMLVIRPVSRAKILLSKYVACLITVYSLAVVGLALSWLFCGFRYGFADYFRPYLWFNGESVRSVPYLIWFLGRAALGSIGFLFVTTLAFGFSNLTKNTAVSIIIPMIIYTFSSVINLFITMLFPKFATYWPLTYIEFWSCVYHKVPVLHRGEGLNDILEMIGLGGVYNLVYGAIILLALTALIYVLSDLLFKKRDIK